MQELNIVELIEKNPISRLSCAYNNKLLSKIKENFTSFEQQLFVGSFYCYLNYDKTLDFVVDLDNVWKWLGFTQKFNAIRMIEKHFKIDIDYKNLAHQVGGASLDQEKDAFVTTKAILDQASVLTNLVNHEISNNNVIKQEKLAYEVALTSLDQENVKQHGGQNKQTIMLTIRCFKSLCLKAQTKKAGEIHEYYMKMEEVMHQIVDEETDELRLQLEQKDNIILEIKQTTEQEKQQLLQTTKKEKQKAVEQATIVQFPLNTECIYFGTIDNTNVQEEKLIKFGHTNNLAERVYDHHSKYNNFILVGAFRVQNKVEIENLIKTYPKIKRHIRSIEVNGKNKTEIIAYDSTNFTIEKLTRYIKDIIHSKTYSIDNFNRLLQQNEELENECRELKEQTKQQSTIITKQQLEINEMREIVEKQKATINIINIETQMASTMPITTIPNNTSSLLFYDNEMINTFNEFIDTGCIVRHDVEESSVNMEGQFRIWSQIKPKKETFHALKHYLDTRFKPSRISKQDKDQVVHGYIGVKLKDNEYKKKHVSLDVETFIFQVCNFSPSGKILNSTLFEEYQRWKKSVNKEIGEGGNDMKEIKEYLNASNYALKAVVWTTDESNEGYYGLSLKSDEYKHKKTSSTGKRVEKREIKTENVLGTWETIAKAALYEGICASKMSLSIKTKRVFNDDYYYCNC